MRVSEYYKLGKSQPVLEFLDVDIENDTKLFLDPLSIRNLSTEFGDHCKDLLQDFFNELLKAAKSANSKRAKHLLANLSEPNETHLGLSRGKSEGRGLGPAKARQIWHSFRNSNAVKSGLIEDLEDTVLLIDGISHDILSDIVTNIIRGPLIAYTQRMCLEHDIPLIPGISSGPVWNLNTKTWEVDFVKLPAPNGDKLILIPKSLARIQGGYNVGEYYRHYVLERLQEEEIARNSALVKIIKTGKNKGTRRVYKTDVQAKYGFEAKRTSIEQTDRHPDLLKIYKRDHATPMPALSHYEIADAAGTPVPDWDNLLDAVTRLEVGKRKAYEYEDAILNFMKAVFYPALVDPDVQTPIHDGLKRVDITFTNYARTGFFEWLNRNYKSPYIFIECKNFGTELGNPEIDQIAMRFSPQRGQFGIVTCRKIENRRKIEARCKAAAQDCHGYVIVLDDDDLAKIIEEVRVKFPQDYDFPTLKSHFKKLVM